MESAPKPSLFTVGHSNHRIERYLELLAAQHIQILVDVRSSPFSRYSPQFNRENLAPALSGAAIKYLFLGDELGGRPRGDEFYDEAGHALYWRRAGSSEFLKGIDRLEEGVQRYRVAITCSEEDPSVCHRHLLVGRVMSERGIAVYHIRGDGRVQSDADLRSARPVQLLLFDAEEGGGWKSLRSVLPKSPPKSSSESSDETESDGWSMSD